MNTRQSRRPHPTMIKTNGRQPGGRQGDGGDCQGNGAALSETQLDLAFAEYRRRVTVLFADHRHLHAKDGHDTCTCGAAWPCHKEEVAAWLLDDWV